MKSLLFGFAVAVVIAAVVAVPSGSKESKRPNYDFVKYFDCSNKPNGNYTHPTDCTRFIICSNGNAADMACADCDLGNPKQCAGNPYLVWNQPTETCEWPETTECKTGGEGPTTVIPDPVCGDELVGTSCGADDCEPCGWCVDLKSFYLRCNRTIPDDPKLPITGVIIKDSCDDSHWWNPDLKPPGASQGGACDDWDNLSEETKDKYRNDPNCVDGDICIFGQDEADKCTGKYWYHDPKVHAAGARDDLSCGSDNVWDPATETCRNRSNVAGC